MSSPPLSNTAKGASSKPNGTVTTGNIPNHQTDYYGTVMMDKGERDVRMRDDTGTPVNWIHPDVAKRLKLPLEDLSSSDCRGFMGFSGKRFTAKQAVRFTWSGRNNRTYYGLFYIAPQQSEIDVLLGKTFVDANGRDREVCNLRPRKDTARLFVPSKETKVEKKEMDANQLRNEREAKEAEEMRKQRRNDRRSSDRDNNQDSGTKKDDSRAHRKKH